MRRPFVALFVALAGCQAEPPPVAFDGAEAREAVAQVAHGGRIADVLGCTGCHGANLQGQRFYELYASNLTRDLADYSDAQIESLLREGVRPNGQDVWGMPSEIFQHLSEPDMAALIAFLRTLQPAGLPTQPRLPFEPETKKLIAAGEIKPAAQAVRESKPLVPIDLGPGRALGRYISRVTCAECHGPKLEGSPNGFPNLVVAGGYTREEFERLMTEGAAPRGRKLNELMVAVAKERFAHMTDQEVDALYAYLKARAERPQ